MINIRNLLNSKHLRIYITPVNINGNYIKSFRRNNNLTISCLSNIIRVNKKTLIDIENKNKTICDSSAVLIKLLNDNPKLINQLYKKELYYES